MTGTLTVLLLTAAVSALASALAPEGKTKKYVQFALSCLTLLILLSAIPDLGTLLPDLPETGETDSNGECAETAVLGATEQGLATAVCGEFSLPGGAVTVTVFSEGSGDSFTLKSVSAVLNTEHSVYRDAVERYLREATGLECEVTVREK